ncbi:MAG: hypothetical protein ACT443_00880 [Gemmatimonadota bacterium]
MDTDEIIGIMAFVVLVAIPALALTARFAMKPIVESIVQLNSTWRSGRVARPGSSSRRDDR